MVFFLFKIQSFSSDVNSKLPIQFSDLMVLPVNLNHIVLMKMIVPNVLMIVSMNSHLSNMENLSFLGKLIIHLQKNLLLMSKLYYFFKYLVWYHILFNI